MRIETIAQKLAQLPEVKATVLFGSIARGDAKPSSDIDLLVITSEKQAEERILAEISKLQRRADRKLQAIVKTLEDVKHASPALLQNIAHHGKLIYLAPGVEFPIRDLFHEKMATLFSYDISHLSQEKKNALNRALYGYSQKTRGKIYKVEGFLEKYGGERIGRAVIMVPSEHKEIFKELLNNAGAKFRMIHIKLI